MAAWPIAVVIVTHNHADQIAATLEAVLGQLEPDDELLVIDNASGDESAARAREAAGEPRVRALSENTGFAGACNRGADLTRAPLLFFLNPDTRLEPEALEALRAVAERRPDWSAWQPLVLLPDRQTVNTWGNDIHYLGFGWAGGHGRPAAEADPRERETSFASGAALLVRRAAWEAAGGFDPGYFTYSEDLDLGLRLWLMGERVGVAPDARVLHDYEFDKGERKWFLLERNRWRTLDRVYPAALLVALAPALVAFELLILLVAARRGWLRAKLRAQATTIAQVPQLLRARRDVQRQRRVSAREFASAALSDSLESPFLQAGALTGAVAHLQRLYWRGVLFCLRGRSAAPAAPV